MPVTFTLGELQARAGGVLCGVDAKTPVGPLTVDSREVAPGMLFCGLPGRYEHGRRHASAAVERGAAAVLLNPPEEAGLPCWVHEDPLEAMAEVGRMHLQTTGARVVGITGSVGKTSVKVLTAAVLRGRYHCEATPRNFNTQIGLPLALSALDPGLDWFVAEMAMRGPGEIRALTAIAPPDVAVITNIGPAHLSELGTMEAILEAKAEILERLSVDGTAILNGDDDRLRTLRDRAPGRVRWYGLKDADMCIRGVRSGAGFVEVDLADDSGRQTLRIPWDGAYQAHNIAAAALVGRTLGLGWTEVQRGLATVREGTGHFRRITVGSLTILDDTYNASPASMQGGLLVLAAESGRRVALLGDMMELGPVTEEAHREAGRQAAVAADRILAVGSYAAWLAEEARLAGANVEWVADAAAAERWCRSELRAGDHLYVKASRAVELDALVARLREWGGPS